MSAKAGKRPLRSLTAHEKLDAIRRVHDGESKASVARDIGVPESTLRGWCKNEEKISYLSRQSSPETDEATNEHKEKRQKLDDGLQPYNLSLKTSNGFSPNAEVRYPADFPKGDADKSKTAADLSTKADTPKSTSHMTEREKTRAELARLSSELGLNRPEVFLSNITAGTTADFNRNLTVMTQYNNILMQRQQLLDRKNNQVKKVCAPAESSSRSSTIPTGGLLTTVKPEMEQKPKIASKPLRTSENRLSPTDENILCWLRAQQALFMAVNQNSLYTSSPVQPTTSSCSNFTNTASMNGAADAYSALFWQWHKQATTSAQAVPPMHSPAPATMPEKPILYQQLTKTKEYGNTENISAKPEEKHKSTTPKLRTVLDNLLFNNNYADPYPRQEEEAFGRVEAVEHGEKFLMWLETCSEPSITRVQIMQFRCLLDNIKSGMERKNGHAQNKTKVKRK